MTTYSQDLKEIQCHAFTIALELVEYAVDKEAAELSLKHMIETLTPTEGNK
jgi:hypothetical protein